LDRQCRLERFALDVDAERIRWRLLVEKLESGDELAIISSLLRLCYYFS
jgi:hypothetical protein